MVSRGDGTDDELDEGLKWRGRVSDDSDSDEDVFGLYAERTGARFDDVLYRIGGIESEDDLEDEDDPLGGLVTIGNLDGSRDAGDVGDDDNEPHVAVSDDFIKQLEDIIERDMPKVKATEEYQKVLDAVDASDGGLVGDEGGKVDKGASNKSHGDAGERGDMAQDKDGEPLSDGAFLQGDAEQESAPPDLGAVLGEGQKDPDIDSLADLIEGLAVDEDAVREKQRRAFAELRGVCSRMMHVAREDTTREEYVGCVRELKDVLERLDADDVHAHRQYVLLPLCVILDAKTAGRWNDASIRGTLDCLRVLSSSCQLDEHEGPPLIQRMLMLLGDAEASYSAEARRGMADVLGAIFDNSYDRGADRKGGDGNVDDDGDGAEDGSGRARWRWTSYLSQEQFRPLVGNALSVLLNHPYNDVTQPSNIVVANQVASITALSKLTGAAGREQMAFFVPGIMTGLAKRLMMQVDTNLEGDIVTSKRTSSGLVAALHAMEVLLVVTLGDDAGRASGSDGGEVEELDSERVLDQLRELSYAAPRRESDVSNPNDDLETLEAAISKDATALWVEATPVWARATAIRVVELLHMCLPNLCLHRNAAVRSQVVSLAAGVVEACSVAFEGHDDVLVNSLLLLAQDDWPSVRSSAGTFLSHKLPLRHRELLGARLLADKWDREGDAVRQGSSLLDLPKLLQSQTEVSARHEAARLCSVIEHCRSPGMPSVVGLSGMRGDDVLDALVSCFEVEESTATIIASAPLLAASVSNEPRARGAESAMPTMPAALRYITSKATYDVYARVVRLLAIDALRNDLENPSSTAFSGFVASCVRALRDLCGRDKGGTGSSLRAAAVVTVVSEAFAGAAILIEDMEKADTVSDSTGGALHICKAAALDVLYAVQDGGIWLLRTTHRGVSDRASHPRTGSSNTGGMHAVLLQRCLVFLGVAARCLKGAFVDDGSCTVTFLLPLIEQYAGDCQYVSASAKDAVNHICSFCGYHGGLRDLITNNIDYVIDGMCIRLRQPGVYPDAPKLFAALLRETGVAVALIPLLADPAQHMIRGVSILQRREKPENVLAFVMCTQEIASGLSQVSEEGLKSLEAIGSLESCAPRDAFGEVEEEASGPPEDGKADDKTAATTNIEEISAYFRERRARRIRDAGEDSATPQITVTRDVWDAAYLTRNQLDAAARLSQSIADSLGPLSVSKSLPVAVQSFTATTRALTALQNAHRGLELFKDCLEERMVCDGQSPPPSGGRQAPPTFLPSVHLFWAPLMGALKDWRVPVVESSIEALQALLLLAPDFLSKRFRTEAWPVLRSMMKDGMPVDTHVLSGVSRAPNVSRDAGSPALKSRIRCAVASLFSELIDALDPSDAESLIQPIARTLLKDVIMHACESTDQQVVDSMRAAFERIAAVHPDSAWATLYTYAVERRQDDPLETIEIGGRASMCPKTPATGPLASFQDFRQWGDKWWWVTNQLQSLK